MSLFSKKSSQLKEDEYLIKYSIIYLNMRAKAKDEQIEKIKTNEDNRDALQQFISNRPFLFANPSGDNILFSVDVPKQADIKKKILLIVRSPDQNKKDPGELTISSMKEQVIFMEIMRPVLDNLYQICAQVYMPVLNNPLNQIGWSDLVSKDLIDKFQIFLAYTIVTIGQVKGRTNLPMPPNDSQSEKTSSKDKSHNLETAIIHWSKQIKNVLKQDPETSLKNGNHPDPLTELKFWENKSANLNSICEQLNQERIKKVLKFLEQNKSTMTAPFSKLQKDVQIARAEANENSKYLQTLQPLFLCLTDQNKEVTEIVEYFVPIMYNILLIWNYSQNYNTPSRLVVLIRQICNAIIKSARNFINGERIISSIKDNEPHEPHNKLQLALDVCSKFKDAYFEYKAKSKNAWKITSNALFVRLDSFSERCQDIMHFTGTIVQFNRLSKIEIGNTKGKILSDSILIIFDEFNEAVNKFMEVDYDILDIEIREFDDDFFKFRQRIKELERRLASILTQAFDDCDTIIGKFKLLDSFEGLLTRPIIQDELERKHITLLELYRQDLKTVSSIFMEGKTLIDKMDERAPIPNNLPPIAGALNWTAGLYERIREPMERLSHLLSAVQDREEYKDVQKLYSSLSKNLREFEFNKIKQWEAGVEESTEDQLNKFLLVREPSQLAVEGLLRVNFDPILVRLLREVKYFLLLDIDVPDRASGLYQKVNVYRTQTGNLELIVQMYNEILSTLLPVEKPLLAERIDKMNKALEPGITSLRWNSDNINPFISKSMDLVTEVDQLVKKMKENVMKMQHKMKSWEKSLFERKNKACLPEELETTHKAQVEPRLEEIRTDGKDIHKLMKETSDAIKPDKKSSTWLQYQDYINGLIIEGITNGINCSMKFLSDQISIPYNRHHQLQPMFDIKVSLQDREVIFDPSIETNSRENGIRDIIDKIVQDFISLSSSVTRIDTNTGDYLVEIKDQFELFGTTQIISDNLNEIENATDEFIRQYDDQKFLWVETLEESFKAFLETGVELKDLIIKKFEGTEDDEYLAEQEEESYRCLEEKILKGVHTKFPSLDQFDEKITHLTKVKHQIAEIKTSVEIGWIRVNSTPLVTKLQQTVNDWIDMHISFLLNNTVSQIKNIKTFIADVSDGIKVLPAGSETQKEKNLLMNVMTHLRDVSIIKDKTLERINPMKETIMLLKKHQVSQMKADDDYLVILENCKTSLNDVSERALGHVKETILPQQKQEATNIKEDLKKFELKLSEFRLEFMRALPYHITETNDEVINKAYNTIDEYYGKTCDLEAESKALNNLETLFDLQRTSYRQIKDCKNELHNLKYMWDLISLIDNQFSSWKKTLWELIDTDNLTQLIKDMQVRQTNPTLAVNKEIKSYKSFMALNERVKQMGTILPLISQLHSKFMMPRHWQKLGRMCNTKINFQSPQFCLEDLIKLELYKYAEDVTEIVDGAQNEAKIENKLGNITKTWETQDFTYEAYKETLILVTLDEITEYVDAQAMDLQGMLASKYVEEFKEHVLKWQKTLKTVDSVIQIWLKVQKNWQRLEPIFLASEDIRAQLPDETKRFEKIDQEWKELMREAAEDPSVISACTFNGREEQLKNSFEQIELCERALNEYLEQKKKIFPRFYYVSNQALLDILSNGNNPEKVNEYLTDCFDGMKSMDFVRGEGEPVPAKKAKGMFSNEGEYVPFYKIFEITGAVENYLNDLEEIMQNTLRNILEDAKTTADTWQIETKRHEWLDDYCAQIALLATQIIWTDETARAFEELESGSETSMKDYFVLVRQRISDLLGRVRTDLSKETRDKIITIITIDVHERDVIEKFVLLKITEPQSFMWTSQLKFYLEQKAPKDEHKVCKSNICDWQTMYNYEYVGNCGRLVITPLTDRCYITLTQALNLSMGGAPAGPAGTGKTETTKDLGRALGLQVVVFNCSDQMNYMTMAQIFMGLSQSGAWGCFDEFNRISIEVLSVVSTQVKYVLDAIKQNKLSPKPNPMFQFQEEVIALKMTVGFFITMNPGYAGRTELPENLKALFRSCAMVVPEIVLICENMLMSEGFDTAKELSKKFMTLYRLAKDLLSPQKHYDWGLRAVKSVLRQAGKLKRAEPDASEDLILMRALRDFNWPKIVVEDREIFKPLISDLFPGIEAAQQTDQDLKAQLAITAAGKNLQTEDGFLLKCIQLSEILEVRHCCFIIGNPGSAKTAVWSTLAACCSQNGLETAYDVTDPKAVSSDELFGCMSEKTKEWKDGVLSVIMRDQNKNNGKYKPTHLQKWIILDGDVDPEWIESLNTVMDDNKVLTLVSNERIPLTPEMRLILEVSNLKNATPATVSRGGVLFINESDIGWKPFYDSWMNRFKTKDEAANSQFTLAQTHYISEQFLDDIHNKETIAPMADMGYIVTLTTIIDVLYDRLYADKKQVEHLKKLREDGNEEQIKLIYEGFFVFAMIWSFGASLEDDEKISFANGLKSMSQKIKFPEIGTVYDYYFDSLECTWKHWQDKVEQYDVNYDGLFTNLVVPTAETTRQKFLINIHLISRRGMLYVGKAGTGKTTILKDYFADVDPELVQTSSINFNSYTDSKALQLFMQNTIEKRVGKIYGPPSGKKLIFFMDDLNMPRVDVYGTQSPIALIRQIIDHGIIYDRNELSERLELQDIMFTACMNPKSGSFNVDLRLTRHFSLVALGVPSKEILSTIYQQILGTHMEQFDKTFNGYAKRIVDATSTVFNSMALSAQLMPTALKFHYQFNLRDFAKIIQSMKETSPKIFAQDPLSLVRFWAHECHRVWLDRLIFDVDIELYQKFMSLAMKEFGDLKEDQILEEPLIYTSFVTACEGHEATYMPIKSMDHLKMILETKLAEYNESVATMDLVLFEQAMQHITRIARIIEQPVGNALLVGVGGSGKQSLSKLTAFILGQEVFRILVTTSYNLENLKEDIRTVFTKAGVQGSQQLFILTDSQIVDDRFLVFINDILSAGYIPDLFPKEDLDGILGKVRSSAKAAGYEDTPGQLFEFFINRVRSNLHMGLCFSPVGDLFRQRARMFPGLINCTSLDWFHDWPRDALVGVADRFVKEIEFPDDTFCDRISNHMAEVHLSIDQANKKFLHMERRHNYTTPTSYLELISFYKSLLATKSDKIGDQIARLEQGLDTMLQTTNQVSALQKNLEITMVKVEDEKAKTDVLIAEVEVENAGAEKEEEVAKIQEDETSKMQEAANATKGAANKELEEAIPAMDAAKEAVACLEVKAIQELKAFTKPADDVVLVTKAVLLLRKEKKNHSWQNAQKMLNQPKKFLEDVVAFNAENIDQWVLDELAPILAYDGFNYENMKKKSDAAANLCKWIVNTVKFNSIYKKVKPLMDSASEAEGIADAKGEELRIVKEKVAIIVEKVNALKQKLDDAIEKKKAVEQEAQDLQDQLDLANRLVGGLADENKRWKENVSTYKGEKITMIGDALVSAAFVSYIGPFSFSFRKDLWCGVWLEDIQKRGIPFTEGVDPLYVLATESDQAIWKTQGLPADRVSLENASVISSCKRYPLMIDPQLQGIKWIKGREGNDMQLIQLSQKNWLKRVENAVTNGQVLMIEAIGAEIDAVLDPLLSRSFVKRGSSFYVKLGSEDVEINTNQFKLYLQTKLINPHYKPETAAQCTIINFIVTEAGLEDQLLAMVVRVEKPEVEQQKEELVNRQNEFKITLAKLESDLLKNLSDADPSTILQNTALIEGLEVTKKTSTEIQYQQEIAKVTEVEINDLREVYRRVAAEGAMLYFLLIQLCIVDHMYQYSLQSFQTFFFKAIEKTDDFEEQEHRVLALRQNIRMTVYQWVSRGLFEKHKQIFLCQITFRLMTKKILEVDYSTKEMNFLIQSPSKADLPNPPTTKKWLPDGAWYSIQKLIELEGFEQFSHHLSQEAPKRFEIWYNELTPEIEKLPLDWKKLETMPFQKLLVIRSLRPDRITTSLDNFIRKTLPVGDDFVDCDSISSFFQVMSSSYEDSTTTTPIFFILSPGANPVKDVEELCKKQGMDPTKMLKTVALGQGQDVTAMNYLEGAHKEGHWVMLQNIHLMPGFLIELEKKLDSFAIEGSNPTFRLFLSADPNKAIPIGLLERSIKLTNEPPQGLKQNMKRAFTFFSKEDFEEKENKIKTIIFALCYFHSVMIERRKFGPKGWNMMYPFSMGDLRDSEIVLKNYMEQNAGSGKIPWDDLKYIFGEIMYGGHIVDDWDRRLCKAYLDNLMSDTLLDDAEMFPFVEGKGISFRCPQPIAYEKYIEHIETELPPETPLAFGMHPNAEIDFRTTQCKNLFYTLVDLQPRDAAADSEGGMTVQEKTQEFARRVQDEASLDTNKINMDDLQSKLSDDQKGPYQNAFLQECMQMNVLINEILKALSDVDLAFKGELTMTEQMETLMSSINFNRVPNTWSNLAFPSTRPLGSWLDNLKHRLDQLNNWKEDPVSIPKVTFLNRLFNPQSFLTAIKQVYSREKSQELNKLYIQTDVLKKMYWEADLQLPREGAYVFGFQVEGARWDQSGGLEESEPKKQFSVVPVINCRAVIVQDGKEEKGVYQCPVYKTENRGNTFVFVAQMKTKFPPAKWILAGVALILDVEGTSDAFDPKKDPPV